MSDALNAACGWAFDVGRTVEGDRLLDEYRGACCRDCNDGQGCDFWWDDPLPCHNHTREQFVAEKVRRERVGPVARIVPPLDSDPGPARLTEEDVAALFGLPPELASAVARVCRARAERDHADEARFLAYLEDLAGRIHRSMLMTGNAYLDPAGELEQDVTTPSR